MPLAPRSTPQFGTVAQGAALGAVVLALVALALPLLHSGFVIGHDAGAHVTYTFLFDRALRSGQVPVRWVELLRGGHSQPLFNFYQPGFYYIVELTHVLVPSLAWSFKWTIVWLWWFGALSVFLLTRRYGRLPAALAAVVFAYSPYLMLDVFVRAAYPEMAAVAFAPAALWTLDGYLRTRRYEFALAMSAFVALMLVCHLPSFLIFSPVFAARVVFGLWDSSARRRSRQASATADSTEASETAWSTASAVLWLCAAGLLAVGMSAFYVLPALLELDFIAMSRLTAGYFDYHQHFVFPIQWVRYAWGFGGSVPGPDDTMSFQIGVVQLAVLGVTLAAAFGRIALPRDVRREALGWLGLVALALFLMTGASVSIWDGFRPLAFVQFPWRFLMIVALAAAVLSALLLSRLRHPTAQAIVVLLVVVAQWQISRPQRHPQGYLPTADLDIDNPSWAQSADAQAKAFVEVGYTPVEARRLPAPGERVGRWTIAHGDGTIRERLIQDDEVSLVARSKTGLALTINSHAFPGWKVWIDRAEVAPAVVPELGYLQVDVPAGTHRVDARLTNTPVRFWSNLVSAVSLASWLVLAGLMAVRAGRGAPGDRRRPRSEAREAAGG